MSDTFFILPVLNQFFNLSYVSSVFLLMFFFGIIFILIRRK